MKALAHQSRTILRDGGPAGNGRGARFRVEGLSAAHTVDSRILNDLVATIGSTRQLGEVLRRAVDSLSLLDGVRHAVMFTLDDLEQLVLRAASPQAGEAIGSEYKLGDGVIGRAGLRRGRPVIGSIATERPAPHARGQLATVVERLPILAVRVVAADDRLLGVLAVAAATRDLLTPQIAHLVGDVARLLALAIEHDDLRASERIQRQAFGALDVLARSSSGETSLVEGLETLAQLGVEATASAMCAVYISDGTHRELQRAGVAPRGASMPQQWPAPAAAMNAIAILSCPATVGSDRLSAVAVVFADDRARTFTELDTAVGHRLAQVAAVLLRQRRLFETSIERVRAEDLLWEVLGARSADPSATLARAKRLGCDMREPHVVLAASVASPADVDRLRSLVIATDRSAIVDTTSDRVIAILCDSTVAALTTGGWSIGLSQPCHELSGYPAAYRQAQEALELGQRLFGRGRIVRFEDLGSYRFVPALIEYGLTTEVEYQQVSRLPDDLLQTLEAYLDSGGNTAKAAKQLFVHRNTLRQRLERITALLDLELSAPTRWLSLQLAIKTARVSRLSAKPASARS